jgi:glutamate synthase (NADPH/NADH) small chain
VGKITGFLEFDRHDRKYEPVEERVRHYREFMLPLSEPEAREQAARCMNCGIPYCHTGCPVNNQIPDWNDLVYKGNWEEALKNLHSTNNFPEFTGRVCPAPCEASCVLNIEDNPVTIKTIECAIIDKGFQNGWVKPEPPAHKTGKRVAIVGSGPAGLACAQQLARAGHEVHVYEKHKKAGGLLRYGIPDFKMEKVHVERRIEQMQAEGVRFHCGAHVGWHLPVEKLLKDYDALVLAGGAEKPRDLPIPGRELDGVHFAMDFLIQQNRRIGNEALDGIKPILAAGKHVVVIGGGDTGSDCIGTSFRQGALSVTNFEIMPHPPVKENKLLTWPDWPLKLRTSSSHEEGVKRDFAVMTTKFTGENGRVTKLHCVRSDAKFQPIPGTEFELPADLVLLAMGFVHPVQEGLLKNLGLKLDQRGNVEANTEDYKSSAEKIFACGDMRRGQSLVVWAIREGRQCAHAIDKFLMGTTTLPGSAHSRRASAGGGARSRLPRRDGGLPHLGARPLLRGVERLARARRPVGRCPAVAGAGGLRQRKSSRAWSTGKPSTSVRAAVESMGTVRGPPASAPVWAEEPRRDHRTRDRPGPGPDPACPAATRATGTRGEQARQIALDEMGELASAGPREMHAVVEAQAPQLTVERGAHHDEVAALVDEAVPDIDEGHAHLRRALAEDLVEIGHVGGKPRQPHGRQTDHVDRDFRVLELGEEILDALGIELAPAVGTRLVSAGFVADHLAIVHAKLQNDGGRLFGGDHAWALLHPVEEIGAHQAGRFAGTLDDGDFRPFGGERVRESLRELVGQRVAEHEHVFARRIEPHAIGVGRGIENNAADHGRLGRNRRLPRFEVARRGEQTALGPERVAQHEVAVVARILGRRRNGEGRQCDKQCSGVNGPDHRIGSAPEPKRWPSFAPISRLVEEAFQRARRRRSRSASVAKPSGTRPERAWKSRTAARVPAPSRPSASPR